MDYVELIAKVCHDANRAYCESIGDFSQKPWHEAENWQRASAIHGVKYQLDNPTVTVEDIHEEWKKVKMNDGWQYGENKDAEKKTHPCLVPYDQLPISQQKKDSLFHAIVGALK